MSRITLLSGIIMLGVVLSACAPQPAPRSNGIAGSQPGTAEQARPPRGTRTLTVAVQGELSGRGAFVGTGSAATEHLRQVVPDTNPGGSAVGVPSFAAGQARGE